MSNEPDGSVAAPYAMAAFDSLPPELKRALWETAYQWCPAQIARRYKRQVKNAAPEVVVDRLLKGISREERERMKGTPHAAAGVSVQRYDARAGV